MGYTNSKAFTGSGLVLEILTVISPETYVEIGEVQSANPPAIKNETEDVTNVQSVGGVKEFIATLTEGGEPAISVNYVPNDPGQQAVWAAGFDKQLHTFKLTLPPSSIETSGDVAGYWDFDAIVTEVGPADLATGKKATLPIKLKVSGLPTFTPEAA